MSKPNFFANTPALLTDEERRQRLEIAAHSSAKDSYDVELTEDEIQNAKDDLATAQVEMAHIGQEKKKADAKFKERLAGPQGTSATRVAQLRSGVKTVKGTIYNVINDENGREMDVYGENGEHLFTRPLKPEERQTRLPGTSAMRLAS